MDKKNKKEVLRIWQSKVITDTSTAQAGTVLSSGRDGIDVATGKGVLRLLQVQPSGKKAMAASDFANAHHLDGQILGTE